MKRISFNIAKVLKEAGYPQKWEYQKYYYTIKGIITNDFYTTEEIECIAPTYLEVWLWLWREKDLVKMDVWDKYINDIANNYIDPEEVIIAAINHLCENNLIK